MPNTEQTLDKLLRFIDKHSDSKLKPHFTDGQLQKLIEDEKPDLDGNQYENQFYEVQRMLKKLIKDGFIDYEDIKKVQLYAMTNPIEVTVGRNYYITYEGRCFEGYVKQKAEKQADNLLKETTTNKLASDSQRLAQGTKYLWIATVSLVVVEILKWIFEPSCH